jgi:predicted DNA-binding protein
VSQPTNGKRRPKDIAEPETTKLRLYAQLGLRLPAELALRLRRYCQESGKSANRAVMEALTHYLAENER